MTCVLCPYLLIYRSNTINTGVYKRIFVNIENRFKNDVLLNDSETFSRMLLSSNRPLWKKKNQSLTLKVLWSYSVPNDIRRRNLEANTRSINVG